MKKLLLLFALMLLPMLASANTVEIDGICYNLISKSKVAVVTEKRNEYAGNVVIPESVSYEDMEYSVTTIGFRAFAYCPGLTSVTIPNSVSSIDNEAFSSSDLTSVIIPNSVTFIGSRAFDCCYSLTSITIPDGVTSISNATFNNCIALTSVTISNSVTSIGEYAFCECRSLRSVTIPNSVTKIGYHAFSSSGLTSVTIPNSVTSINQYAFLSCSALTSVTIGSGIKDVGSYAFASCKNLTDVFCLAENVPSASNKAFQNSYIDNATLHVPAASIQAYKAVEPWKNFKEIKSLTDGDITGKIETQKTKAMLIQTDGGTIQVQGVDDGTPISVFGTNGSQAGFAISQNGAATINTTLPSGSVAIVKVGEKSIKVIVK